MKIQSLDFIPLEYPFHGYFKFIGPRSVRAAILVKMVAEDGTVGWGQSLPVPTWSFETVETALAVMRQHFAPAILGLDAADPPGVQQALDRALAASFSTPMPITRAGIDLALHDLYGKLTGQSLCQMWGRPPGESLRLSWTVNVLSLDDLGAVIENGRRRGYSNFNIKIGGGDPQFDVELARQVRRLAPDGFLWADGNCGFDLATALLLAPQLAAVGVDVLESPLPPNRISGYQALRRQGALPIVMDEGVISPVDAEEFIRLGMMDGLTVKVSRRRRSGIGPAADRAHARCGTVLAGQRALRPGSFLGRLAGPVCILWAGETGRSQRAAIPIRQHSRHPAHDARRSGPLAHWPGLGGGRG